MTRLLLAAVLVDAGVVVRLLWEWNHLAVGLVVVGAALAGHVLVAPPAERGPGAPTRALLVARIAFALRIPLWIAVFVVRAGPSPDQPLLLGLAVVVSTALFLAGWNVLRPAPAGGRAATGLLLVTAAATAGIVSIGHETGIDVLMFQEVATDRVLAGQNPYAPGYPVVYDPPEAIFFYGEDLVAGDELTFGFPYPPVSLLLVLPGALLGDVRVAHVAAVVLTGWLLLSVGRGAWHARVAAVFLLLSPVTVVVTYRSWTEVFLVLALAAVVWTHERGGRWRDPLLGVLFVTKQYALGLAPLALLLLGRPWRSRATLATAARVAFTAAAVTVPWIVWNPPAFWRSMVELLLLLPFRPDSMSLVALAADAVGWPPRASLTLIGVAVAGAAILLALARAPRTARGFALAVAVVLGALFLFSKQAFGNYYFVVIGAVLVALAVPEPGRDPEGDRLTEG